MTIASALTLLNTTKTEIKNAIEAQGVTVGAIPFSQYSDKIALIEGGTGPTPVEWVRPTDWLAMPTVLDTEEKFVGLHAVFPEANFVAIQCRSAYTVDWGDGVVEAFATNTVAYHEYDYDNVALAGTETTTGYKQALVVVTPQSGQVLNTLSLYVKHNQSGLQSYTTGWLDLIISGPNMDVLTIGSSGTVVRHNMIERVEIKKYAGTVLTNLYYGLVALKKVVITGVESVNSATNMFTGCTSLTSVPLFTVAATINASGMFSGCKSLTSVPAFTSSVTNMSNMFNGCTSLTSVPLFNTASVTLMDAMFNGCTSLTSVPLFNTASVTNMSSTFYGCPSLTSVPLFNTAGVTAMASTFYGCTSLTSVPLFNTASVTNMSSMFRLCASLVTVPLFNTASVTNMTDMFRQCDALVSVPAFSFDTASVNTSGMFTSCMTLPSVPALDLSKVGSSINLQNLVNSCTSLSSFKATGAKFTFTVASCKLSGDALNEIYTNLATVTGQTLTVTGNYGVATDDPTIATAKGWTITG